MNRCRSNHVHRFDSEALLCDAETEARKAGRAGEAELLADLKAHEHAHRIQPGPRDVDPVLARIDAQARRIDELESRLAKLEERQSKRH